MLFLWDADEKDQMSETKQKTPRCSLADSKNVAEAGGESRDEKPRRCSLRGPVQDVQPKQEKNKTPKNASESMEMLLCRRAPTNARDGPQNLFSRKR